MTTTVHMSRKNGGNTLRMNDLATIREVQAINVRILDAYHEEHLAPLLARVEALEAKPARPWWKLWGKR